MQPPSSTTTPTPITRQEIVAELNDLLALELDAIAAFHAAIERVGDPSLAAHLATFKKDHEGHLQDLSAAVEELGGRPRTHIDYRRMSTEGRVAAVGMEGDRRILEAMSTNEHDTVRRYDGVIRRCGAASPGIKELLARHLHDERRHRAWLDRWLLSSVPR